MLWTNSKQCKVYIYGKTFLKKRFTWLFFLNSPYLLNDSCIYNRSLIIKKNPFIHWMTLIYIIGYISVKKIPFIYWMTLVKGPSLLKNILIYWMTLVYIIGHSSFKKNSPYSLNDPHIYNRFLLSQKNSPYLLNNSCIYNRSFSFKKDSLIYSMILLKQCSGDVNRDS